VISITGKSYRLRHQAAEGPKPAIAPTGPEAEPVASPEKSTTEDEASDGKSASTRRKRDKQSPKPAQT
jgi:hypothetical protein